MIRAPAQGHRGASAVPAQIQDSIMQRLMLSAQGTASNGMGRSERSREEMPFNRNFPPQNFQAPQINGEMVDLWSNPNRLDGFPSAINGTSYGYGPATVYANMFSLSQLPPVYLRCPDCGIVKMSSEEMEVHIKVEHLVWHPFQCTMCDAERAADFQLREHIQCAHKQTTDKFIYVDNPNAKRTLQIMMDRCLMSARRTPVMNSSQPSTPPQYHASSSLRGTIRERIANQTSDLKIQDGRSTANTPPQEPSAESALRNISALSTVKEHGSVQQQLTKSTVTPTTTSATTTTITTPVGATATVISRKRSASDDNPISWNTNTDAVLSAIRVATHENENIDKEGVTEDCGMEDGGTGDEEDYNGNMSVGKHDIRSAFDTVMDDPSTEQSDEALLTSTADGNQDTTEILGNVAAIFSADSIDLARKRRNRMGNGERPKCSASSLAKKRVLGECSRCKKPVTAGARQMHMFFHLGKDCKIFRFRCQYPACEVEHYRKDQMENHQSKVHGKINPMLIEDRTAELFSACQELSMQLLGTTGNVPGPTAARAQMAYEALLAAQAMNPKRKKRVAERTALAAAAANARRIAAKEDANRFGNRVASVPSTSKTVLQTEHNDEQMLECKECHKTLLNRVRGYHILWHMANDLQIYRYVCKICNFGQDRAQAVLIHGKEEHGTEDCVEDRIEDYSDVVKSMSERCFGSQTFFSHDNNRKQGKQLDGTENEEGVGEFKMATSDGALGAACSTEENDMYASSASNTTETSQTTSVSKSDSRPSTVSAYRDRMRKARNRRFGTRKPPSKMKRKEMAKLREISMLLGGAQYFKKRFNEAAHCQKCGILTTSRLSAHAYKHLDVQLFLCPQCDIGNQSRDLIVKHIREVHESQEYPVDERWKYLVEIKEIIRECYPAYFVDAPIPTASDIEKLKKSLAKEERFDPRMLGNPDDGVLENEDAEQDEVSGEVDDGESDDGQQVDDGNDVEQEVQPFAEETGDSLDDNVPDNDEQQHFVMEDEEEQFPEVERSDIAVEVENGYEVEGFADASSDHSSNSELLENQDVSERELNLMKKKTIFADLGENMVGEAQNEEMEELEEEEF